MAVASLVLGIIALLFSLFGSGAVNWLGVILGIVGIILGVLGKKNDPERAGMATAGIVLSIIAIVLGLIIFIACLACVSAIGAAGLADLY